MTPYDQQDSALVISVVYDGPPRAGKTTSVRALARGLGREVYTPEERDGRTVFFDLLEYVGGRFDGSPIRCQVASVPGQRRWTRRRGYFLDRADVVVFVGDTSASAWPQTVERLAELREQLDRRPGVPVGLVFQANKRDAADAVALEEIQARASSARTAVIESVASGGSGVREAFVFAVRLALDRVRGEQERGIAGARAGFEIGSNAVELVETLKSMDPDRGEPDDERAPLLPPPPPALAGADAFDAPTVRSEPFAPPPLAPSHDAPTGLVWPPIEGRILLREASVPARELARVTANGDYVIETDSPWRMHSAAGAAFANLDEGRRVLVAWARQHAAAIDVASPRRCIVLAETGTGAWRLWQIVRREPTLREMTIDVAMAERIVADAAASCARARVACTLDTIGLTATRRPVYVGLMPLPDARELA